LIRYAFPLRIRHRQPDLRSPQVRQRLNALWIASSNHDLQIIRRVSSDTLYQAMLFHFTQFVWARLVHIRPDLNRKVASVIASSAAICLRRMPRKRFVEDVSLQLRMMLLKSGDQLRQNKELVATDKDDQLRIGWIAVQTGNIVHIRYAEVVSPLTGRIVGPLTPWRGALGHSESQNCISPRES
jgi:hypothetical protein